MAIQNKNTRETTENRLQTELMLRVCRSTWPPDTDSDTHSAQTLRRLALNIPAGGGLVGRVSSAEPSQQGDLVAVANCWRFVTGHRPASLPISLFRTWISSEALCTQTTPPLLCLPDLPPDPAFDLRSRTRFPIDWCCSCEETAAVREGWGEIEKSIPVNKISHGGKVNKSRVIINTSWPSKGK